MLYTGQVNYTYITWNKADSAIPIYNIAQSGFCDESVSSAKNLILTTMRKWRENPRSIF